MIDFFKGLFSYIEIAVNFISSMLENLLMLVINIPRAFTALSSAFAMLPPFIIIPIMGVIGVSVIVTVLNKWG